MSFRFLLPCLALSVPFFALACSSSGTGGDSSGVDEASKLTAIDATEKAALCDWTANQYGGYGKEKSCEGGSTSHSAKSQEECVKGLKFTESCAATVGDYQKVAKALIACKGDESAAQALGRVLACASISLPSDTGRDIAVPSVPSH